MSLRNAAYRVVVLTSLVGSFFGCSPGESTSEPTCADNQVLRDGACVQTCESDENCSASICLSGYCEEAIRPTLSEVSPADDAQAVAVDSVIELTFSQAMVEPANGEIELRDNDSSIDISMMLNDDATRLTLRPVSPLSQGKAYSVVIGESFSSVQGIPIGEVLNPGFTTVEALNLTDLTPSDEQGDVGLLPRIELTFSKEVTELGQDDVVLNLSNGGPEIALLVTAGDTTAHWVLIPEEALTSQVEYALTIGTGVTALDGAVLDAPRVIRFTTGDYSQAESPTVSFGALPESIGPIHLSENGLLEFTGGVASAVGLDRIGAQIEYEDQVWDLGFIESAAVEDFSFFWNPSAANLALNGAATLVVEAVDLAGNVTRAQLGMVLDFVGPTVPLPQEALPELWKFKTVSAVFESEIGGELIFDNGDGEPQEVSVDEFGLVARVFTLPALGETLTIQISARDAVGNLSDAPLQHTFTRAPYSCLHVDAGFPTPDATTEAEHFVDDEEGTVTVRCRLNPDIADDTVLHGQLTTQNFSSTPYLSLYFFPRVLGLLKFSDSLLHPCAELVSAKLGFYNRPICPTCELSETLNFYGVKRDWLSQETTWVNASTDASWTEAGLSTDDRDEMSTATIVYESVDGVDSGHAEITALVQAWIEYLRDNQRGRANHGVAFFQDDSSRVDFHSVDASNPEQVPYLELVWAEQP